MNTIPIVEIFGPTLQGEGPNVGARCIFVRVKGCSFKCKWCDSKFTWNDHAIEATEYEPDELSYYVIGLCKSTNCYHVVLTGGNPCLYSFGQFILDCHAENILVDIETQGDIIPNWLTCIDTIVFSPKAPSSGMLDTYDKITDYIMNSDYDKLSAAIKVPVFSEEDIDFARKYARFVNGFKTKNDSQFDVKKYAQLRMYLSVGNTDVNTKESIRDRVLADYETLLNKINENPEHFENVYILPQLHTLVWGNKQGV